MKLTSRAEADIETFFGTKREINNTSGASSTLGVERIESTNASTKKAKVQTCEGILPWKISEHKKTVVLYTEYAALISKPKYTIGFYCN